MRLAKKISIILFLFVAVACQKTNEQITVSDEVKGDSWDIIEDKSNNVSWLDRTSSIKPTSSQLSWLDEYEKTALRLSLRSNRNFSSTPNKGALVEWFSSNDKSCDGVNPMYTSERVWVGFSKPFLKDRTVFIECSIIDGPQWYQITSNLWVGCTPKILTIYVKYNEGHNAYDSEFNIPDQIKEFFFLPYIYEERDWKFTSQEQSVYVERPDEVVKQPYPDVVYYSEDIGKPKDWAVFVAKDNGETDRIIFEHKPTRLHRRSVMSSESGSSWYRPREDDSYNSPWLDLKIKHVEPVASQLNIPKRPSSHSQGIVNFDEHCYMSKLPK